MKVLRGVSILATAGLIAQCINFIFSIWITRLYSPESFSVLVSFLAALTILQAPITGKYEVAIVTARTGRQERGLFVVAILSSFICIFALTLVWGASSFLGMQFYDPIFLSVLLCSLFIFGLNNAFLCLNNKHCNYKLIGSTKVIQAFIIGSLSIAFFYLVGNATALLFSYALGLLVTSLCYFFWTQKDHLFGNYERLSTLARNFSDFPKYNASTSFLTGLTNNLPIIFIGLYYSDAMLGVYGLILRVVGAPVNFLAAAISQVHLRKVVQLYQDSQKIHDYFIKICASLLALVVPLACIFIFFSKEIFSFLFDDSWGSAAIIAPIICSGVLFKFVGVSLATTLVAIDQNKLMAIWKIGAFLFAVCVFFLLPTKSRLNSLCMSFCSSISLFTRHCSYFVFVQLFE